MKKPFKKITWLVLIPSLFGVIWIFLSIFFAALSFHIYSRFSYEKPIASIYFEKDREKVFNAYLSIGDEQPQEYKILGDQWRLDAQFIKLKPWANIFGLDALYHLERFEGRYKKIKEQNSFSTLAHDLSKNNTYNIPEFLTEYNFLIDAEYGSSTYLSINESLLYVVYQTQSGIIVRQESNPGNDKPTSTLLNKMIKMLQK